MGFTRMRAFRLSGGRHWCPLGGTRVAVHTPTMCGGLRVFVRPRTAPSSVWCVRSSRMERANRAPRLERGSRSRHGLVDYPRGQLSRPPRASPSALRSLRGTGQRGFTSHDVMRTGVVGRAADRAPAPDATHSRDTDSLTTRKGSVRDRRVLLLQRFGPFGDWGNEGSHLTV
jgi:hypothetical protein